MTRYFMKFTPLFAAEVQMMTPPRHQPRRSGRIRSSFRYSADDVRCKDCTRYDSGHPCHLNECVCLEERIEAGVVELNALARECFGGRLFRPLQRRLRDELNRQPFCFFLSDAHRERWTHWKNRCYGMSERNAAALLLLTADEELWQRVLWHFDSSGFDFPAIRLSGIHPELYSIYQAAKTISVGGDTGSFSSYKVEYTGYSALRREYGHFSGDSRREGVKTAPDCIGGSYLCLRCRQRRDRFCGTGSAAYGTKVNRWQTPRPYARLHAAGGAAVAFGRHAGTVCLSAEGDPGWYRDLRAFGSVFSVPAPQVFLREDVYAFTYAGKGFVCRI